jgi:hypothetical protein
VAGADSAEPDRTSDNSPMSFPLDGLDWGRYPLM